MWATVEWRGFFSGAKIPSCVVRKEEKREHKLAAKCYSWCLLLSLPFRSSNFQAHPISLWPQTQQFQQANKRTPVSRDKTWHNNGINVCAFKRRNYTNTLALTAHTVRRCQLGILSREFSHCGVGLTFRSTVAHTHTHTHEIWQATRRRWKMMARSIIKIDWQSEQVSSVKLTDRFFFFFLLASCAVFVVN